jgi:hypothetical protein
VVPRLIAEQRAAITALDADLDRVSNADDRVFVAEMLRRKRQHLPELEALSSQPHTVWK